MKPELLLLWANKKLAPLTREEMKDLPLRLLKYAYDHDPKTGHLSPSKFFRLSATYLKKALALK